MVVSRDRAGRLEAPFGGQPFCSGLFYRGIHGRPFRRRTGREYDCLEGPLLSRLSRDATGNEIREYLARELVEHFGVAADMAASTDPRERAVRWYAERWGDDDA